MIKTCKECGKDFLTESDPFVIIPYKWTVNCGCFFTKELEEKCAKYEREIEMLRRYGNRDCTAMADEALEPRTEEEE